MLREDYLAKKHKKLGGGEQSLCRGDNVVGKKKAGL